MGPAALLLAFSLVAPSALAIEEPNYQVIESGEVSKFGPTKTR